MVWFSVAGLASKRYTVVAVRSGPIRSPATAEPPDPPDPPDPSLLPLDKPASPVSASTFLPRPLHLWYFATVSWFETFVSPNDILIVLIRSLIALCRSFTDFFSGQYKYAYVLLFSFLHLVRDGLSSFAVMDTSLARIYIWECASLIVTLALVYLKDLVNCLDCLCLGLCCHTYSFVEMFVLSISFCGKIA